MRGESYLPDKIIRNVDKCENVHFAAIPNVACFFVAFGGIAVTINHSSVCKSNINYA